MPAQLRSEDIVLDSATLSGAGFMPDELVRLPESQERHTEHSFDWQALLNKREVHFDLFNGHYLKVQEIRRKRVRENIYNLAFVSAEPQRLVQRSWGWLIMAGVMLALGLALLWAQYWLLTSAVMAAAPLLGVQFARRCRNRLASVSAIGQVPLFEVETIWASKAAAERFAALLVERIQAAEAVLPTGRERLASEMAEHRRLFEAGSLSADRYEQAKKRILQHFSG
jgi:hypothetical protein